MLMSQLGILYKTLVTLVLLFGMILIFYFFSSHAGRKSLEALNRTESTTFPGVWLPFDVI